MSEYFILRRGKNEITGDKLGDKLTLTYMTEDGQTLPTAPSKAGTYKVKATLQETLHMKPVLWKQPIRLNFRIVSH